MVQDIRRRPIGKQRIIGVDAARGAALIAMMITHLLPAWDENYERTVSWFLFAGRGPALFALLAGVSLAFMSGGRYPPSGRNMTAVRYGLTVRAVLIALVGMTLAYYLPTEIQVILVYYAAMFVLALPLLRLRVRTLLMMAGVIAVAAPFLMQGLRDALPDMEGIDPNFTTVLYDPGGVLGQVLLTGTYPALPWMSYLCLGLALGRMDLTSRVLQVRLLVAGVGLAVVSTVLSSLLLGPLGGEERLVDATSEWSSVPQDTVTETLIWGPDPTLPTDTWWWLAALTPYSTTPITLFSTTGTALAVLGAILLLAGANPKPLRPLAMLGKMTLSLYSLHLVLDATGMFAEQPLAALAAQLVILLLFAYLWQRMTPLGPLERIMTEASKWARTKYLAAGKTAAGPGKSAAWPPVSPPRAASTPVSSHRAEVTGQAEASSATGASLPADIFPPPVPANPPSPSAGQAPPPPALPPATRSPGQPTTRPTPQPTAQPATRPTQDSPRVQSAEGEHRITGGSQQQQ